MYKIRFLLMLSCLLLLASCGDLFKKTVVKRGLQSTRLSVNCTLDIDQFANIMKNNISSTINCMGENLYLFMKLDETTRNGYLSHKALVQYLKKNEPDMSDKGYKIIAAIFDINYLIYGESPDLVSRENLGGIVELALVLNREASLIYDLSFGSHSPGTYASQMKQKERINNAVTIIRNTLMKIYRPNRGETVHKINLISLLESFIKDPLTIEKLKKLIFLKSTLLGGVSDELTHIELKPLIDNLPKIGQIALDIVRYKYLTLTQTEEMLLLRKDFEFMESIIFHGAIGDRDNEQLFNLRQAFDGVVSLAKNDDLDYEKYKNLFIEAKQMILKGEPEAVTGADLKRLINHGKNITKIGLDYNRFYFSEALFSKLEGRGALSLNAADFTHLFPLEVENLKDFIRIGNTYRFQPGASVPATYAPDYFRNSTAMAQIGMVEYLLKIFMERHGVESHGIGGKSIGAKDVISLVKIYETELLDLGVFLPRKGGSTANTISLLGSLFQYQSDDNSLLDVNEAAEFALTFITSSAAGKKMMDYLKDPSRNCSVDNFDRIEPNCFRQNFFPGVCQMYKDNFPSLLKYLGTDDCSKIEYNSKNAAFLDMAIKANRTCMVYPNTSEEIFYSQSDTMALVLVLMHIETTILRWDINGNNFMDKGEVLDAFAIYKPAIEGMLPEKYPILKKVSKQVYQYLVRFEKAPEMKSWKDVTNLLKFVFVPPRGAPADRKTIAAVLKAVSDQALKKTPEYQRFQCEWLRDPDHIPRDP